jgi:hypothetical protein
MTRAGFDDNRLVHEVLGVPPLPPPPAGSRDALVRAVLGDDIPADWNDTVLNVHRKNLAAAGKKKDRLRVKKLVPKVDSWVTSAVARRIELWDDSLVIPPALAARAAVLAFGDELLDFQLPSDGDSQWFSKDGRKKAVADLLPRAEAALRQELQGLADAAERSRKSQSSSSSGSRAL